MPESLYPRHLKAELLRALATARVVNVVGPRQVGKTTLVRDLFSGGGRFVTLDTAGVLAAIDRDPDGQLDALTAEAGSGPLVIDEAQRSKQLALAIKKIVDERRRMGQFLITGSSNIFTTASVADSLAGRVRTLKLLPLSGAELHRAGPATILDWASQRDDKALLKSVPKPSAIKRADCIDLLLRGGYPEIRALPERERRLRHRDHVDAIVDRDVSDVLRVRKTDAMRRLIDQLAARTANELNVVELSRTLGVQRPTVETYLDVLERLSLIARLGSWASGEAKREARHPKIHFYDTGMVAALRSLGLGSFAADQNPAALGAMVESYVYGEIIKNLPYQQNDWRLYHWRDRDGHEIDILAEMDRTLIAIETKAAADVVSGDIKNIQWFKSEGPGRKRRVTGIVIYLGTETLSLGDRIFALPLSVFWSSPAHPE